MSRHNPLVSMQQMLDHAREAVAFSQGRARGDLEIDRQFYLAMVHLIEIVGEAATRVPPAERARYLNIPWNNVVALRNRLVHEHDRINRDIVWKIVTEDLSPLIAELEKIVPPPAPK